MNQSKLSILRLNIGGAPIEWLNWEDAACLYARDKIAWSIGEPIMEICGGRNRMTGLQTKLQLPGIIASTGTIHLGHQTTPTLSRRTVFMRDQHLCMYCGDQLSFKELTLDHIIPVSRGGKHNWTNVISACKRCNQIKSNKTPEEAGMQLLAVPYRPNRAEYLALINSKRIRSDQMQFLSSHFSRNWRELS